MEQSGVKASDSREKQESTIVADFVQLSREQLRYRLPRTDKSDAQPASTLERGYWSSERRIDRPASATRSVKLLPSRATTPSGRLSVTQNAKNTKEKPALPAGRKPRDTSAHKNAKTDKNAAKSEHAQEHEALPGQAGKKAPKTVVYKVAVKTGDSDKAGTVNPVYITMKGTRGFSARTRLIQKQGARTKNRPTSVFMFSRGTRHVFTVTSTDLGKLKSCLLEHESLADDDGWFCDFVEVSNTETNESWTFHCNKWLSLFRADGMNARELYCGIMPNTVYKVTVVTGDKESCNTDSRVFITLFGKTSVTPRLQLAPHMRQGEAIKAPFSVGQSDTFDLQTNSVGPITKIRVQHDASGVFNDWFLDRVVVSDMRNLKWTYFFGCNQWFSRAKADGLTIRELRGSKDPASKALICCYKVTVYTGDREDCGCDCDVTCNLIGKTGQSGERKLIPERKAFARCGQDEFMIECPCLGELKSVQIGHNNRGLHTKWYVRSIVIDDLGANRVYDFPCHDWISTSYGAQLRRELKLKKEQDEELDIQEAPVEVPIRATTDYEIRVITGDKRDATTSSDVYIIIHADKTELKKWNMKKDQPKDVKSEDEKKEKKKQKQDKSENDSGSESTKHDDAKSDSRTSSKNSSRSNSPTRKQKKSDKKAKRTTSSSSADSSSSDEEHSKKHRGKKAKTKRSRSAGDSNKSSGSEDESESDSASDTESSDADKLKEKQKETKKLKKRKLVASERIELKSGKFKRGHTDVFKIQLPTLLSPAYAVTIGIKPMGSESSWFCDKVILICSKTKLEQTFVVNDWLAYNESDRKIERFVEQTSRKSLKQWTVKVQTSDLEHAGTDSNIFFTLYGEKRKNTGEIQLSKEGKSYLRDQVATEKFTVMDVGQPSKLRVRSDGKGKHASWHLKSIEMIDDDSPAKDPYTFACNKWLQIQEDENSLIREMPATGANVKKPLALTKYIAKVYTGDRRFADATVPVFLNIFGSLGDTGERPLSNSLLHRVPLRRAKKDEFHIEAVYLGKIEKIRIGHHDREPENCWFLDKVELAEAGHEDSLITFPCMRWFNSRREDGETMRELYAPGSEKASNTYVVIFKTKQNVFTEDSAMHIQLLGTEGKTEKLRLTKPEPESRDDRDKRSHKAKFSFSTSDVGRITNVHIGHDEGRPRSGWFLEEIVVQTPLQGKEYKFVVDKWMDKNDSDDAEVDLKVTDAREIDRAMSYEIRVWTGMRKNADTRANVFVTIFGNLFGKPVKTESLRLRNESRSFAQGSEETFKLQACDVGRIQKIRIGHDNSGQRPGWYLDKVLILKPVSRKPNKRDADKKEMDKSKHDTKAKAKKEQSSLSDDDKWKSKKRKQKRSSSSEDSDDDRVGRLSRSSNRDSGRNSRSSKNDDDDVDSKRTSRRPGSALKDGGKSRSDSRSRASKSRSSSSDSSSDDSKGPRERKTKLARKRRTSESSSSEDDKPNKRRLNKARRSKSSSSSSSESSDQAKPSLKRKNKDEFDGRRSRSGSDNRKRKQSESKSKSKAESDDDSDIKNRKSKRSTRDSSEESSDSDSTFRGRPKDRKKKRRDGTDGDTNSQTEDDTQTNERDLLQVVDGMENYWFFAERWLAKDEGDQQIEVELMPSTKNGEPLTKQIESRYQVKVKTSEQKGTGCNENFAIILYGNKADSGERQLVKPDKSDYRDNRTEVYQLKCTDVGKLDRIRLRQCDSGSSKDCFVEYVEVTDEKRDKKYVFLCKKWFSIKKDDGQVVRDLLLIDNPEDVRKILRGLDVDVDSELKKKQQKFIISVTTGDKEGAETDAKVFLILYGLNGDSGPLPLKSKGDDRPFKRGKTSKFELAIAEIGEIKKLKIWHDNRGNSPDWYLEKVVVDCPKLGTQHTFPCGKWLADNTRDGQTEATLYPHKALTKSYDKVVPYEIVTYTSENPSTNTTAVPYICVYGQQQHTAQTDLIDKNQVGKFFKPGKRDKFSLDMEDIDEPIQKIRIGHDNAGVSPAWHVEKVEVKKLKGKNPTTYVFPCGKWIDRTRGKGITCIDLIPEEAEDTVDSRGKRRDSRKTLEMKQYLIKVYTGEGATDASIYLTVFGNRGDSGERQLLESENLNKFERNQVDTFKWECADLGKLFKVNVRSKGNSVKPEWLLDKIEVFDIDDRNEKYQFLCERWLSAKRDDCKLERTLYVKGYRGEMSSSGSMRSRTGSSSSIGSDSFRESPSKSPRDAPEGPTIPYTIKVHTGQRKDCGTASPVWIKLRGPKRHTGRQELDPIKRGRFEPGMKETFSFDAVDIRDLKEVEICKDDPTPNTGWFVERLEIDMPTKGKHYQFDIRQWLASDKGDREIKRIIKVGDENAAVSSYKPHVMFEVTINTGDKKDAGTDAKCITIQIFGDRNSTEPLRIEKNSDRFERNQSDSDRLEVDDVGKLKKIRVTLCDPQDRPDWFLDQITMRNTSSGDLYKFEYGGWLGKKYANGIMSVDLPAMLNGTPQIKENEYRITVRTSDKASLALSARVFILLIGEFGDSNEIRLKKSETNPIPFSQNQTDKFTAKVFDLGELSRCRVWHDNNGISTNWHLSSIEVEDVMRKRKYFFPCDKWLSRQKADRQTVRDLNCESDGKQSDTKSNETEYVFEIKTPDRRGASMQHNLSMQLIGELGKTKELLIENSDKKRYFQHGETDKISLKMRNIGKLRKIRLLAVKRDGVPLSREDEWLCERIAVTDNQTGKRYVFELRARIPIAPRFREDLVVEYDVTSTEASSSKALQEVLRKAGPVAYEVTVVTGNEPGGGTNANVYLTIFGELGDTGKRELAEDMNQRMKDKFERNQTDKFLIEAADVGHIKKIRIEHDNTSPFPGWFLDRVEILNTKTKAVYTFPCNKWLDKEKGDRQIFKELFPLETERRLK